MYISDGARALLSAPIEKEWSQTSGEEDTAFSDHKGDSCVTRIFRGRTAQEAQGFADVWIARLHDRCFSPASDIVVRRMTLPRLGDEDEETNLVVAVSAYDLDLKDEIQEEKHHGRTVTTRQGVVLQENPDDPTRVGIQYESKLIESMTGNISYDGQLWRVNASIREKGELAPTQDALPIRIFKSLIEALRGMDEEIRIQERRIGEHIEKVEKNHQDAREELDYVFSSRTDPGTG